MGEEADKMVTDLATRELISRLRSTCYDAIAHNVEIPMSPLTVLKILNSLDKIDSLALQLRAKAASLQRILDTQEELTALINNIDKVIAKKS